MVHRNKIGTKGMSFFMVSAKNRWHLRCVAHLYRRIYVILQILCYQKVYEDNENYFHHIKMGGRLVRGWKLEKAMLEKN
ncbi:MAG TPA: hypothetical protein PLS07_09650 [Niabella sp.]|nr:hypothetical protein [Niabella sp.]HQW13939.1 hypothetical protein [Niabella sp.]HQX19169.1 hypothetical protein [Niabella sp.]HQX42338.1 hypothetical protein [Niabella sp.]HRB06277.1 hypothetical protein [Niabella sp.]